MITYFNNVEKSLDLLTFDRFKIIKEAFLYNNVRLSSSKSVEELIASCRNLIKNNSFIDDIKEILSGSAKYI